MEVQNLLSTEGSLFLKWVFLTTSYVLKKHIPCKLNVKDVLDPDKLFCDICHVR